MASALPIAELFAQKMEAAKKTGKLQLRYGLDIHKDEYHIFVTCA